MSNDSNGFAGGGRERGDDRNHESNGGHATSGGAPGARAVTQSLGGLSRGGQVRLRVDHAAGLIEILRTRLLPDLRAALLTRSMDDARTTSRDVERDLSEIGRELREARRMTRDPQDLAEIADVEARADSVRDEAIPLLARAPTPGSSANDQGPALVAHEPGAAKPTNVIDASARFGAGRAASPIDQPAAWDEQRATIDDSPRSAVQRRASARSAQAVDVPRVAAAGVSGSGGRLPHLDAIQRSFGAHDVSGVQAHVGGAAADAAGAIGAEAYATGNSVAFASDPSLFVAAHEAAHVVQQRAGVHLLGGVGEAGDAYEQHADAVAECVVRGESATELLGRVRSPGGDRSVSVQRRGINTVSGVDKPGAEADPVYRVRAPTPEHVDDGSREARRDGWRPLLLAGHAARDGYSVTKALAWHHHDEAVTAALAACTSVATHLEAVLPGKHDKVTASWFVEALATSSLLLYEVRSVGSASEVEAKRLAAAIAVLQQHAPSDSDVTPQTEEEALAMAGKPTGSPEQRQAVAPGQLRIARRLLVGAVETFRGQQSGRDASVKEGGSSDNKAPIFVAAAQDSGAKVAYLLDRLDAGDFEANDEALVSEAAAYVVEAQRFAYWAMGLDAVKDAAQLVADAAAPLAKRFGLPQVVVADPMPSKEDHAQLDSDLEDLVTVWGALFERQENVLEDLEAGHDHEVPWYQSVAIELAQLCITAGIAALTGGMGATVVAGVGDAFAKAAVSALVKDTAKELFKGVTKWMPEKNTKAMRKAFFKAQRDAVVDERKRAKLLISDKVAHEARHSPDGLAMVLQLTAMVGGASDDVEQALRRNGIQAWASYLARAAHGTDKPSGGVDLDRVGQRGLAYDEGAQIPQGVMVLLIKVASDVDDPSITDSAVKSVTGTEMRVVGASVLGLADSDRAALEGLRVSELRMPVQAVLELDGRHLLAASSNGKGAYWMRDQTVGGVAWLADQGFGEGAAALPHVFDRIANLKIPTPGEG